MCRIVSTSLLLAAGIAVSACNVTSSGVAAPKAGTPFKNGHVYDIESDGTVASVAGTQQAPASENGSGGSGERHAAGSMTLTGPNGSSTTTTYYSDGTTSGHASGQMSGSGTSSAASSGQSSQSGGQSSQPQRVSATSTGTDNGGYVMESQYSDGTYSREYFDGNGNLLGSEGGTL